MQPNGYLEAALENKTGAPAIRILLDNSGSVQLAGQGESFCPGSYGAGEWLTFDLEASKKDKQFRLYLNGKKSKPYGIKWENPESLQRVVFRTGKRFELMAPVNLPEGQDRTASEEQVFLLDDVTFKK
jgi:hypothetical protein